MLNELPKLALEVTQRTGGRHLIFPRVEFEGPLKTQKAAALQGLEVPPQLLQQPDIFVGTLMHVY